MYTDKERRSIQRKLAKIDGYQKIADKMGKSKTAIWNIFSSVDRYNKETYDVAVEVLKEYNDEVEKQKLELMPLVK